MQDRFKFRIFYADKMVYPNSYDDVDSIYECLKQQVMWDCDIDTDLKFNHTKNNLVFMQCTGLKDKNGKLIFEGDIVIQKFDDKGEDYCIPPEKTIVIWQQETAYLGLRPFDKPYYGAHSFSRGSYCEYEVIGNIYENEELLNGNNT